MTTRRRWITLSLIAAAIAVAAIAVAAIAIPRTIALVQLLVGPAVTFQAGRGPAGIVISPDGRTLYAVDNGRVAAIPIGG